jgi:phenylacetate-CoA ligase
MAHFHTALVRYRPSIVQAYAGAAVLFAQFLQATGRTVPPPRALITSAEMLTDADRALLERVFRCPVFNRYGCREVSVVASECAAHAGLHIMAEGLLLEIETPRGPAAPGEMGAIFITDLLNEAMPLIRYRIGDVGAWAAGPCSCGRTLPRLERLEGRVTDFLVGARGQLVSGVFLATYVVADRPSLGQVRILQEHEGEIEFQVRPGPNFDPEADAAYLEQATRRHLGDTIRTTVRCVDALPNEPSGKYLFSRSRVAEQRFRVHS